jgi:RimJ/RimL family protein N-acetyltransferase
MNIILETNRLFLRELCENDYKDLCEILQDKDVMYAYEHSFSKEEVENWYNQQPRPKGRGMLFSRGNCTQGFNTF